MCCNFSMGDSLLPVTALEYVPVGNGEILLAGEGPKLKAFSRDTQLLCTIEAIPFSVIHGIQPLSRGVVLVFGQKVFRIVKITGEGEGINLQCVSDVVELADWILDAILLRWEAEDSYAVAVMTAHNVLISYVVRDGKPVVDQYPSEVSCILDSSEYRTHPLLGAHAYVSTGRKWVLNTEYSALLVGSCLRDLIIASGTVFNKILLWHIEDTPPGHTSPARDTPPGHTSPARDTPPEQICVRLSFVGHQGVIFSVKINDDQSQLLSASDDRTIRLWAIPKDWRSQKRTSESKCLLVLYGHTARVWLARPLPDCIVSVGEDAVCKVWSYNTGEVLATFKGHRGKSVWALAVDRERKKVATGGGDCSIRVYNLRSSHPTHFHTWMPPEPEGLFPNTKVPLPRTVFLMGSTALCLTDQGSIFAGQLSAKMDSGTVWSEVYQDVNFSNYSLASLSEAGVLALGNIQGSVRFLKLDQNGTVSRSALNQPYSGKVFSLNWTPSRGLCDGDLLFSCGPDGAIVCWKVDADSLEAKRLACFTLPASKHRWVTTVSILHTPSHLFSALCGDRKGSLHLYQLSPGSLEKLDPYQSLYGVHGPNGVTYSCVHEGAVFTCGRNGLCRKYRLEGDGRLAEITVFKPVKGLDWLEKVHFTAEDTLFVGFHGIYFVVHSTALNRRLMNIACGGGHRSYAISPLHEILARNSAQMVFIKQAEVSYGKMHLEDNLKRSLIQPAFVGLEAGSLVVLDSNYERGRALVAVGSEDSSICLVRVCPHRLPSPGSLEVLHMLQGHASSVKALCSSRADKILLFSGGSRASLKVWTVGKDFEVGLKTGLSFRDRKGAKQKVKFGPLDPSFPPECRVMSLTSFSLDAVWGSWTPQTRGDQSGVPQTPQTQGGVSQTPRTQGAQGGVSQTPQTQGAQGGVSQTPQTQGAQGGVSQTPQTQGAEGGVPQTSAALHYVAAGCSDAVIRHYIYNDDKEGSFYPLPALKSSNKCVICLRHFFHRVLPSSPSECGVASPNSETHPVLCSTSTDGHVTLWDLLPVLTKWRQHYFSPPTTGLELEDIPQTVRFKVHQSGINNIAIQSTCVGTGTEPISRHVLISVGDDNALRAVFINVSSASQDSGISVEVVTEHVYTTAHASAITGVSCIDDYTALTSGIDQRLNVWKISQEDGIQLLSSHTHDVADPSSLVVYHTREYGAVAILCGVGLQYFTFQTTTA